MQAASATAAARVERDGEALVFAGVLDRAACAGLWRQLAPLLAGVRRLDLTAVSQVDSAGLALLAEAAAQAGVDTVVGAPAGLAELRAAYRLDATLGFAG